MDLNTFANAKAKANLVKLEPLPRSERGRINAYFNGRLAAFTGQFYWGYQDINNDRVLAGDVVLESGRKDIFAINFPLDLEGPDHAIGEYDSGLPWVYLMSTSVSTTGRIWSFKWEREIIIQGAFECQLEGFESIAVTGGTFYMNCPTL
ncbi:hypothetical protein HU764_021525 [Pseudomonas sp. SWRI100]|uniref:hypothetical protein n=1 Tax=Pseudomonas TaxID=286 RepID=UPI00164820B9|nr:MULTISPECIES: hypothetical protein [Pseudomonas]MBC3494925.1 hypothetical protein [Pseudomonas sp. SWRI67]MBV4528646.1 hypothetical protein [Pseudomonas kermanshahensis]